MASKEASAPPPPPPTTTAGEPAPRTLEEAEAALARAEHSLRAASEGREETPRPESADHATAGAAPTTANPQAGLGQPAPQAQPRPAEAPKKDEKKGTDAQPKTAGSACEIACRALGSMKRAAEAICRMTSQEDDRCLSARKRVNDSASRVERCSCVPDADAPPG
jgi:hypothetical protein